MKTRIGFLATAAAVAFISMLPVRCQSADVIAAGKQFVELLAKQDFAAAVARYDDTMAVALPEPKLRDAWQMVESQAGRFQKQLRARSQKVQGYDVVFVTCQFEKMALDTKVVFNSEGRVSGLFFVPAQPPMESFGVPPYADTNLFREREFRVGSGEWTLPGTLSVPQAGHACPAIVLVHGSGPQDRDETIGANKPFRDLAWGLASRGIAVLRYEKRTKQYAEKLLASAASITLQDETVDDALAAVKALRSTQGIDPQRVFVLGHSLGGVAVPRIAKAEPGLAGIVVMAGSTRPLEELIVEQTRYIVSLEPKPSPEAQARLAEVESLMARVKKLSAADASSSELLFGAGPAYWLDLRSYDQVATAKLLKQRLLIIQGGRDYQVTKADFDSWKKGLEACPNVTFKLYPELNHLFMRGVGKSTPSEYEKPGNIAEAVVADIAAWISQ